MGTAKTAFYTLLFTIFFFVPHAFSITFDDGGTHIINYAINDSVSIGGSGTSVEIRDGADIVCLTPDGVPYLTQGVYVWDTAEVSMTGGYIWGALEFNYDSTAVVSGGDIGEIHMFGSQFDFQGGSTSRLMVGGTCQATISGGSMNQLWTFGNSLTDFSGGSLSSYDMRSHDSSILNLIGSGFQVTDLDGITTTLDYGDRLSNFGTFIENDDRDYYTGTITGTLADGTALDTPFSVYNTGYYAGTGDIVIVPEPSTILFLLAGSFLTRIKKGRNICPGPV